MENIRLDGLGSAESAQKAARVLRQGGVVLYPTDTLYALGADALSDAAVEKIYEIKGRDEKKPMHCIVADMDMAQHYALPDAGAHILAKTFLPGPLTLILRKREGVGHGIGRGMATIGIRIPNNDFCVEMAREFGGPVTTTSANRSGAPSARRVEDILRQLGDHTQLIDLVIDAGELPKSAPSTVVDLSGGKPTILREGTIPAVQIFEVWERQ